MGEVIRSTVQLRVAQHRVTRDDRRRARGLSCPRAHQVRNATVERVDVAGRIPFGHSSRFRVSQHGPTIQDTDPADCARRGLLNQHPVGVCAVSLRPFASPRTHLMRVTSLVSVKSQSEEDPFLRQYRHNCPRQSFRSIPQTGAGLSRGRARGRAGGFRPDVPGTGERPSLQPLVTDRHPVAPVRSVNACNYVLATDEGLRGVLGEAEGGRR